MSVVPGRSRAVVFVTVLGVNALALALVWTWGTHSPGVLDLFLVLALTVSIIVGTVVGLIVAAVRTRRPGWWDHPGSTGQAAAAGVRAAAWGLVPAVVIAVAWVNLNVIA